MSKRYYQGETFPQKAEVRDVLGVLIDPDTIVITIVNPEGTKEVDEQAMSKEDTGEYCYTYLIAEDAKKGKWITEIKAEKGYIQIEQDEFTVMERV